MTDKFFTLNNGYKIPSIGFGTFLASDGDEAENAVLCALEAGYRHIDTAAIYKNEKSVGRAIKKSGVPREEIFVTSKLWNDSKGYDATMTAFSRTLENLGLDYLDLYLIHWPIGKNFKTNWVEANAESWRAFEDLYNAGKIRAIGVSNFMTHHLDVLLKTVNIMPMVNQIELHPGMPQDDTVNYCRERNILIEAWAPFSSGKLLNHPLLNEIAQKHGKTTAQICLAWVLQKGVLPLAKSVTPERITNNFDFFDIELTEDEIKSLNEMPNIAFSATHPDKVEF